MKIFFKKNYLFFLVLILTLVKGLFWLELLPPLQTPDTERHFSTIQWFAEPETKKLVAAKEDNNDFDTLDSSSYNIPPEYRNFLEITQFEQTRFNPNNHQIFTKNSKFGIGEEKISNEGLNPHFTQLPPTIVNYPPLYYKTASWIYLALKNTSVLNRIYAIEVYSLFLSIFVLIFAYKSARLLNFSKTSASLFMGIISMQPMFSQASISINPDILLILGMTLFTFFSISIIKKGFGWKNLLGIIASAIVASEAKTPGIIAWPIFATLLLSRLKKELLVLCVGFLSVLSTISYLTNPSFLVSKFGTLTAGLFATGNIFPNYTSALEAYLPKHFNFFEQYELFASYWGWFGWLDYSLHKYIFILILILIIVAIVSFFTFLFKKNDSFVKEKSVYLFLILFLLTFHVGIVYSEFSFFKNYGTPFGLQGRYFLPTIVAYFLILTKGFQFLFKKIKFEHVLSALFISMIFLNIHSLISVILPGYYL